MRFISIQMIAFAAYLVLFTFLWQLQSVLQLSSAGDWYMYKCAYFQMFVRFCFFHLSDEKQIYSK